MNGIDNQWRQCKKTCFHIATCFKETSLNNLKDTSILVKYSDKIRRADQLGREML